ncbi:MAG: radical SAM protein [Clostridia bacterium]|nr:radical SAM protein [Clostridia bacterium]
MSHSNISIFVPHIGCPCKCSFCNQFSITKQHYLPKSVDVDKAVSDALKSKRYNAKETEIAFFGGSFTAIDREYMTELLSAAKRHIDNGNVSGIRISTRPDCIDNEILDVLKEFDVTAIELGAQSMRDEVLSLNNRGHSAADVYNASMLIKKYGFELGLQMMTGLYGDDDEGAVFTANEFVKLEPKTVRIYPTIVLNDTYLAEKYRIGEYAPQTVGEAVGLCTRLILIFENEGIDIIRLGLHTIDTNEYVAGPWHPAFSELCENEIYRNIILSELNEKGDYTVSVARGEVSKAIGQKRSNIDYFDSLGYGIKIKEDNNIYPRNVKIERE